MRKWCVCQMDCIDFKGWACCAHLAEGFVPECPYTEDEIDPEIGLPRKRKKKYDGVGDGVCQDYRSYVGEVTKRLRG